MKLQILFLLLTLAASCQDKKDKKNESPASPPTMNADPAATAPATPAPTDPAASTPAPASNTSWQLTKENCAAVGRGFDAEKPYCLRIATKEACDLLANGSKFELRYGVGECIGPRIQPGADYCAGYGQKFDQALNNCQAITTKAECDALANGSVFDSGYERCIGVKYLPNVDNCAAYGAKYDAAGGKCIPLYTEAECTALNSGAIFDAGYEACIGRCEHRNSILDECFRD